MLSDLLIVNPFTIEEVSFKLVYQVGITAYLLSYHKAHKAIIKNDHNLTTAL